MVVRLEHPRLGRTVTVQAAAAVEMALDFPGDATYSLTFQITGRDGETFVAQPSEVRRLMPPITPQADTLNNPHARLPMMDKYGYSAVLEAAQRRREWASLRIVAA